MSRIFQLRFQTFLNKFYVFHNAAIKNENEFRYVFYCGNNFSFPKENERLSWRQVFSFFSRMAAKLRSGGTIHALQDESQMSGKNEVNEEDAESIGRDETYGDMRNDIIDAVDDREDIFYPA